MEKGFFQKKENVNLQEVSQVVSSYGYNNNFAWFVSSFSGASGDFLPSRRRILGETQFPEVSALVCGLEHQPLADVGGGFMV